MAVLFSLFSLYSTHLFFIVTIIVCTDDGSKYNRIWYTRKVFFFTLIMVLGFFCSYIYVLLSTLLIFELCFLDFRSLPLSSQSVESSGDCFTLVGISHVLSIAKPSPPFTCFQPSLFLNFKNGGVLHVIYMYVKDRIGTMVEIDTGWVVRGNVSEQRRSVARCQGHIIT